MSRASFQELDVVVDRDDYRPAILRILAAIRPQWKKETIYIGEMEEKGFLNFLFKCAANTNDLADDNEEKIIVRVFGPFPFHRESEAHIMRMLSDKGMIPLVYGKFTNGLVYQYAPGKRVTREQLKDEELLRSLAMKIHAVRELDVRNYIKRSGRPSFQQA